MIRMVLYDEISHLETVDPELRNFVEREIFPRYAKFFSHGLPHIYNVVANTLMLAEFYHKDFDLAYTAAACHDLGLKINRKQHELASGEIVAEEKGLQKFFSAAETQVIREAVEDHRGSRKISPRSFYGRMISDADRDFELETLAWRTIATSVKNYTELKTCEEHFDRCYAYISQRIARDGHFNLWTNNPILVERRAKFEEGFFDRERYRDIYFAEYERLARVGELEKIQTYYEDF